MKKKYTPPTIILVFLSIGLSSLFLYRCQHESENISDLREVCFEDEVLPLFRNSCGISNCHDAVTAEEDYIFTDYANIVSAVNSGDALNSPAYISLVSSGEDMMPPDNPLPLQSRQLIRVWIDQGAMNTTCRDTGNSNNGGYVNPRACFQRDILPVLLSSCGISGCHDAITKAGDYLFIDHETSLKSLKPGDPNESDIYEKITEKDLEDRMPPTGYDPLPSAQIDSIYQWILYGALDEECGQACDTSSVVTWSENIWPIIESNCRGCHSGVSPSGNINLTSYTQVSAIAANDKLTGVIRATGGNQQMPPSGALPICSIRQIELWVDSGYQNNK